MMLAAAVLAAVGTSCSPSKPKNCPPVTSRAIITETDVLRGYLRDKGIAVQEDSLGYFYTIEEAGTGKAPNPCSDVTVDYEGTLANGMPFDAGKNVSFNLSQLILGWQMGIPKIKEGGKIILYLPPSIAYGDRASGDIPPHSNLIFKIALKKVE